MLRNTTDYLLGVRPTYDGLLIDPCIPAEWKEYKVRRRFRGSNYEITFKNPGGVSSGVKSVMLDGEKIEGNLLPSPQKGQSHQVIVILGKA